MKIIMTLIHCEPYININISFSDSFLHQEFFFIRNAQGQDSSYIERKSDRTESKQNCASSEKNNQNHSVS